jgi:hypothetical protein
MAKHVILESYSFNRDTKTVVVVGKNIRREQLLLITNVTAGASYNGTVIYNFSDPALGAATYTNSVDTTTGQETTTIVLNYATSGMLNTDALSILVEETYTEIIPAEVMRDSVDKLRVSTPQALIDTDFEYGQQPTKWESVTLLNNRPAANYDSTSVSVISAMTASGTTVSVTMQAYTGGSIITAGIVSTITGIGSTAGLYVGQQLIKQSGTGVFGTGGVATVLSVDSATGITVQTTTAMTAGALTFTTSMPTVGQVVFVQGTLDAANADGWWLCTASTAGTGVFTYSTILTPAAALYDATKTYVYYANFYSGSAIPAGTTAIVTDGTRATVTTTNGHGLRVGDSVFIVGSSTNTAINTNYIVERTPTTNTFTFLSTAAATTHTTPSNACIYPRPLGYSQHRPFDGGVQFTNLSPYHGYQVIRQTRRQFRYQSGKSVQFSTGSILKPALFVDNITNGGSGTTITVTTKYAHGILPGAIIRVTGSTDTAYNGDYTVLTVANPTTLTYTSTARIDATGATPALAPAPGFPLNVAPLSWYGSYNRVGMFDGQNGFFFEHDGQNAYCVKRSSTQQISGSIAVNAASNAVTGTNTKFSQQLKPGDYIVIRGMSYLVQQITTDTAMLIYPEYRGAANITNVVVSKTIDTRYAQSTWNIDKMNGTGASLMNIDFTKMQMFYMDFTWYGAGAIRFGFKNNRGEVTYCHRIPNNNLNTESYMRSGNLVARYETNTLSPYTYLTATLTSGVTTSMTVADTTAFPSAGTVVLSQAADTGGVIEYVSYTSKTATTLVGLTRNLQNFTVAGAGTAAGGSTTATTFTVTGVTAGSLGGTAPIKVELYSPQQASTISHWGSSVIMDGRYDDDKSLVFVGGMNRTQTVTNIGQDVVVPLISIRVGPTVDNGQTGALGARDIINRMQLVLRSISTFATGSGVTFLITLRLNGRVSGGVFSSVGGSSLSQVAIHGSGTAITGGENVYGFYNTAGVQTEDLNQIRDLGTSILGGGTNNLCPTTFLNLYPDGPDIITICATNVTAVTTNSILARISWTEAQA